MIRTRGLTKRFGRITAVDGVDLDVRAGDRFGFLGPNGSGKTTLVRMLLGLVHATAGEIEVLGERMPAAAARVLPRVGAMVEGPAAYPHLSGRRNLSLFDAAGPGGGRRGRVDRVEDALARVGLSGVDKRAVSAYSLGMRQRLGLAAALLRGPSLLILDEPTNGLDPKGIREIRDLLIALNEGGTTVFLSSHLLAEVELLCTRVGIVDRGRMVLQDDLDNLRAPTGQVLVRSPDVAAVAALLAGRVVARDGEELTVRHADAAELNAELVRRGLRVSGIAELRRTLEQVVLESTGDSGDRVDRPPDPGAAQRRTRPTRGGDRTDHPREPDPTVAERPTTGDHLPGETPGEPDATTTGRTGDSATHRRGPDPEAEPDSAAGRISGDLHPGDHTGAPDGEVRR
ncbi:ABC transporter ATP-binding protein [Actinokineospora sp. NBRC 105648]|uniref:ABC transporter ATP-binding protein n=1 Tax=Actinokineospora sp. NBRC 105648 TaxID=3032206 RepID=UPI0024A04EEB|nr:ABC transporter ATP-binding protein [Actinokineospora sp. NBRC 105648]GLZ41611.1 hypothetical protein Acsp05_52350 [Actinokineospora sp. NBRC 105648]